MAKTLAIINQKGGVGKTSITYNLGHILVEKGYKILFIDTDPQCNLTGYLKLNKEFPSVYNIMNESEKVENCIQKKEKFDAIASHIHLSKFANEKKAKTLKNALDSIQKNYDFIIIDTPPQLSAITVNCLVASTSIVIPTEASLFALEGIKQLYNNIQEMREVTKYPLKIEGIILNRYKSRTIISQDFTELLKDVCKIMDTKVFDAKLRDSVIIVEAQANRQSIMDYAPTATISEDYKNFAKELLETIGE